MNGNVRVYTYTVSQSSCLFGSRCVQVVMSRWGVVLLLVPVLLLSNPESHLVCAAGWWLNQHAVIGGR